MLGGSRPNRTGGLGPLHPSAPSPSPLRGGRGGPGSGGGSGGGSNGRTQQHLPPCRDPARDQRDKGAPATEADVLRQAAAAARLSQRELAALYEGLLIVLPDLEATVVRDMRPATLAALCMDPAAAADRLVRLRQLLPRANVSAMVALRPSLLANGKEFDGRPWGHLRRFQPLVHTAAFPCWV